MDIIVIIALVIFALYLLKRVFYLIHVIIRKKSRDVEMGVAFGYDDHAQSHLVTITAPFYDEKKCFYIGFAFKGFQLGFTPVETMHDVIRRLFRGKSIAQTCYDFWGYPDLRWEKGLVSEMRQDGVELLNGVLIYSPDAIERGCLEYGITDGLDRFLIFAADDKKSKFEFERNVDQLRKIGGQDAVAEEKTIFNSEGEIIKLFEGWTLFHRDKREILNFTNAALRKGLEKLFKLNKLDIPDDFNFPRIEEIFSGVDDFSNQCDVIKLYFDENNCVIYRERGKKYDTYVQKMKYRPKSSPFKKMLSLFIPEIVNARAYSKRSLRRLGVKFLITFGYTIGTILGLSYISFEMFKKESYIVMGITFVLTLLSIVAFVMAVYYLFLGIFSRKEFIKVSI